MRTVVNGNEEKTYYRNGNLWRHRFYNNDTGYEGECVVFHANGQLCERRIFKDGKLIKTKYT